MAQIQGPGYSQHCFLRPRIGRKDHAGRHDSDHDRRRQAAGQRRRRHEHLRLRRRGEASSPLDRVDAGPLRPRRQALQPDRHARLSRLDRPGDRRAARRRHRGDRDRRPLGHRASTRGACFKRPASAGWAGSSSSTRWTPKTSTSRLCSARSRNCSASRAFRCNVPLGHGTDFKGVASTLNARQDRRRAGRPGRDSRIADRVDHRGRRGRDRALLRGQAAHRGGACRG